MLAAINLTFWCWRFFAVGLGGRVLDWQILPCSGLGKTVDMASGLSFSSLHWQSHIVRVAWSVNNKAFRLEVLRTNKWRSSRGIPVTSVAFYSADPLCLYSLHLWKLMETIAHSSFCFASSNDTLPCHYWLNRYVFIAQELMIIYLQTVLNIQ